MRWSCAVRWWWPTCVYIPIQPSQYDLWTLEHMQELVVAAQGFNPALTAFVLLTRVSTHPLVADTADARLSLEGLAPLQLARAHAGRAPGLAPQRPVRAGRHRTGAPGSQSVHRTAAAVRSDLP